jgi:hypothetical protein
VEREFASAWKRVRSNLSWKISKVGRLNVSSSALDAHARRRISCSQLKPPTRDEVYFSIARRVNQQSESPGIGIVNALDEVIEVGAITTHQ